MINFLMAIEYLVYARAYELAEANFRDGGTSSYPIIKIILTVYQQVLSSQVVKWISINYTLMLLLFCSLLLYYCYYSIPMCHWHLL